ncbi:hypothetical protein NLO62_26785, partial [Escherichia coli]|nr:hypothetical protein [Escherichia coli]
VYAHEKQKRRLVRSEFVGATVSGVVMMVSAFSLRIDSLYGWGTPAMIVATAAMGWFARGVFSVSQLDPDIFQIDSE